MPAAAPPVAAENATAARRARANQYIGDDAESLTHMPHGEIEETWHSIDVRESTVSFLSIAPRVEA